MSVLSDEQELDQLLIEALDGSDFPFDRSPFGPWVTGALTFVLLLIGELALAVLFGARSIAEMSVIELGNFSMLAVTTYTMTMNEVGRRGFVRDYIALTPLLVMSAKEKRELMEPVIQRRMKGRIIAGLIFSLVATPIVWMIVLSSAVDPGELVIVSTLTLALMFFVVGAAMFDTFFSYRRMLNLMKPGLKIDLLNLRPLEVIGRTGVRVAIMMAGGAVLATPLLTEENALFITSIFLVSLLIGALLILILPAIEASRAIRGAKERELRRITDLIKKVRRDLKDNLSESQHLQGLIAYRNLIDDIHELPIGAPTFVRVFVIAMLPVASVLVSVMLEQIVEKFL